jgi:hypothetical protein
MSLHVMMGTDNAMEVTGVGRKAEASSQARSGLGSLTRFLGKHARTE